MVRIRIVSSGIGTLGPRPPADSRIRRPREYAATVPTRTPMKIARLFATIPTVSDVRAP